MVKKEIKIVYLDKEYLNYWGDEFSNVEYMSNSNIKQKQSKKNKKETDSTLKSTTPSVIGYMSRTVLFNLPPKVFEIFRRECVINIPSNVKEG